MRPVEADYLLRKTRTIMDKDRPETPKEPEKPAPSKPEESPRPTGVVDGPGKTPPPPPPPNPPDGGD